MIQLQERLSFDKLFRISDPKRVYRSFTVKGPPLEIDSYQDTVYYIFNFKSNPSTTGLRHRGYIKFFKPVGKNPQDVPLQHLDCLVDCMCPDYRYRWAWSNKQRQSSVVGPKSLNQAWNRAPKITNPTNKPGLCVAKDELVTTRNGFTPVQDVKAGDSVWTLSGWNTVTAASKTGHRAVVTVSLKSGRTLRVTPNHPVYAFSSDTGFSWVNAGSLTPDHRLCVTVADDFNSATETVEVPAFTSSNKAIHYPAKTLVLDACYAELFGYMISEGSTTLFAASTELLRTDFSVKWMRLFGEKSMTLCKVGCMIGNHGFRILKSTGYIAGSYRKEVPAWLFRSTKATIVSFLRGCYAGDGCFRNNQSVYGTVSEKLARGIQTLLAHIGISATVDSYLSGVNKSKTFLVKTSSGEETSKLYTFLNPLRGRTAPPLAQSLPAAHNYVVRNVNTLFRAVINKHFPVEQSDELIILSEIGQHFPECARISVDAVSRMLKKVGAYKKVRMRQVGKPNGAATASDLSEVLRPYRVNSLLRTLDAPKTKVPDMVHRMRLVSAIDHLHDTLPEASAELKTLVRSDVFFDRVVAVTECEPVDVYDLTVEHAEHFAVNGVIVHNCKHLLAARQYIYGLMSAFEGDAPDTAYKLDRLTKFATTRWTDINDKIRAAKAKEAEYRHRRELRNMGQLPAEPETSLQPTTVPTPAANAPTTAPIVKPAARAKPPVSTTAAVPAGAEKKPEPAVPTDFEQMKPEPLPDLELAIPPGQRGRGFASKPLAKNPAELAIPPGQRGRGFPAKPKAKKPVELAIPPGQRGRGFPAAAKSSASKPKRVLGNRMVTPLQTGAYGWVRPQESALSADLRDLILESVVNMNGYNMSNIKEAIKLVEEMEADELSQLGSGVPQIDDVDGETLEPSEPPVSDSAIGADTEGETALSLLRSIKTSLEQIAAAVAPIEEPGAADELKDESDMPPSEGELPEEPPFDIEAKGEEDEEEEESEAEEEEEEDEKKFRGI